MPFEPAAEWRYNLPYRAQCGSSSPLMPSPCKHPRVRVVSRQDDVEFVECQDCGEVFDSDEFRDMEIEEKTGLADPLAEGEAGEPI
jgi:hypothetical protein